MERHILIELSKKFKHYKKNWRQNCLKTTTLFMVLINKDVTITLNNIDVLINDLSQACFCAKQNMQVSFYK